MTSKRARHVSGKGAVWHMFSEQATLAKMPKYNGYACGYGAHGNAKYHRAKSKRAWKAQMQKKEPLGLLPDCGICSAGSLRL